MIVYVETNFLLEVAYLQERCDSCQEIIELAKVGAISLAMPAFSAAEARATWRRRVSERQDFLSASQRPIRDISRSQLFRGLGEQFREVVRALAADNEESRERLENTIRAIEAHGTVIPLTSEIVMMGQFHELAYSLSPQDALVLASVRSHAENEPGPKCFVSQDAKDFANPMVYDELSPTNCKVIANFADALAYIRNAIRPPG